MQLGGSAELEVKDGASLLVDGSAESVWGPGTNVAINNGGSLGGTGTIRVQGGISFASPNTGSVLTSGAGGNGHMVVEGHALVVANGLGVEGGYQRRRGGRRQPAASRRTRGWRPSPGTTTTIQAGATLELTGDGGFYRELGRRTGSA